MVTVAVQDGVDILETAIVRPTPNEAELEGVHQVPEEADQPCIGSAAPPRDFPAQRVHGEAHVGTNTPNQVRQSAQVIPRTLVKEPRIELVESRITRDPWHLGSAELASPFLGVLGHEAFQEFLTVARLV